MLLVFVMNICSKLVSNVYSSYGWVFNMRQMKAEVSIRKVVVMKRTSK